MVEQMMALLILMEILLERSLIECLFIRMLVVMKLVEVSFMGEQMHKLTFMEILMMS